jgi:hypothetical protein
MPEGGAEAPPSGPASRDSWHDSASPKVILLARSARSDG